MIAGGTARGRSLGLILALLPFCSVGGAALASDPLEDRLIRSMQLNRETWQRAESSGAAVRAYVDAGYASAKPTSRLDYTDYRILKKPARLHGQLIAVLEEEYPSRWIGCCVSPGIGAILRVEADLTKLREFAASNGCTIDDGKNVAGTLRSLGVQSRGNNFVSISCRDRDIPDRPVRAGPG